MKHVHDEVWDQVINQVLLQSQLGESKVALLGISSRVNKFQRRVFLLNSLLDLLPVNLELSINSLGFKVDN